MKKLFFSLLLIVVALRGTAQADECPRVPDTTDMSPQQADAAWLIYYTDYQIYCSAHVIGECACQGATDVFGLFTVDFCQPASEKCPYRGTDTTYCMTKNFPRGCNGTRLKLSASTQQAVSQTRASADKILRAASNLVNFLLTIDSRNRELVSNLHVSLDPIIARATNRPFTAAELRRIDTRIAATESARKNRHDVGLRRLADFQALLGANDGSYVKGDLNRDNKLDYVMINPSNSSVEVWLNNAGRYQLSQTVSLAANSISLIDQNGDGKLDLRIDRIAAPGITLPGNGRGNFLICANQAACWQNP